MNKHFDEERAFYILGKKELEIKLLQKKLEYYKQTLGFYAYASQDALLKDNGNEAKRALEHKFDDINNLINED